MGLTVLHRQPFGCLRAVAVCLAAFGSGCSGPAGVETLPVRGRVTLDGKSAAGASVWLVPEAHADASQPPPYLVGGIADANGDFELITDGVHPGAPPGKYLVGVTWPDPNVKRDREGDVRGKDGMPEKVRNPRTSGLVFEVRPDQSEPRQLDLRITKR
ncbi:MAG: hypothetical protein U0992_18770 [Planctomycetaceae bacterium]